MGQQETYARLVLRRAFGSTFSWTSPLVFIPFGDGAGNARLDGVIGSDIVVEIESRTPKQIRGAILDLLAHPISKKLLVIVPAHMHDPAEAAVQARVLLDRMCRQHEKCAVVLLAGNARSPDFEKTSTG